MRPRERFSQLNMTCKIVSFITKKKGGKRGRGGIYLTASLKQSDNESKTSQNNIQKSQNRVYISFPYDTFIPLVSTNSADHHAEGFTDLSNKIEVKFIYNIFFQTAYPVFSNQKHISFCQVTYPTTFSYYNFPQIIHHCSYCMGKPTSNKAFIYQWPFQVYFKIITGCRIFCTLHPFLRICL